MFVCKGAVTRGPSHECDITFLCKGRPKSAQQLHDSTVAVRRAQSVTVPSSRVTRMSFPRLRSLPDLCPPTDRAGISTPSIILWPKTSNAVEKDAGFAIAKKNRHNRCGHGQKEKNVWDRYGDPSLAAPASASAEENGRHGAQGRSEKKWETWGPWHTSPLGGSPVQPTTPYTMQPVNPGEDPRKGLGKRGKRGSVKTQDRLRGKRRPAALIPGDSN